LLTISKTTRKRIKNIQYVRLIVEIDLPQPNKFPAVESRESELFS